MSEGDRTTQPRLDAAATSIVGTVREHNEDAACAHPDMGMVAVADGLGGHNAGERASGIAIEVIEARVREIIDGGAKPSLEQIFAAFEEANLQILDDAGHFSHEDADHRWLSRFREFAANHHEPSLARAVSA